MLTCRDFVTTFTALLTGGAQKTTPERQKAKEEGEKKHATVPHFVPTEDTYFVKTKTGPDRFTVVLGWDHALLVRKTEAGYVPVMLLAHGDRTGKKAYGELSTVPTELIVVNADAPTVTLCGVPWTSYRPPADVVLERLVTYGVSSCSFAALGVSPDWEYVAVSHMSGVPPIPVAAMMTLAGVEGDSWRCFVSTFPQETEIQKVTENASLRAAKVSGVVALRGKAPAVGDGAKLYPQIGHTEVGVAFRSDAPPLIEGIIGCENENNYSRLLPTGWVKRLKNFRTAEAGDGPRLLFETLYRAPTTVNEALIAEFADQGFTLPRGATLQRRADFRHILEKAAVEAGTAPARETAHEGWEIVVGGAPAAQRTYVVRAHTERVEEVRYRFDYRVETEGVVRNGSFFDNPHVHTKDVLNNAQVHMNHATIEAMQVAVADVTGMEVTTRDSAWLVRLRNGSATIRFGERTTRQTPRTTLRYFSASESTDIVTEIMRPLRDGALGFASVHTAIFDAIAARIRSRGASKVFLSRDARVLLQRALYLEVEPDWTNALKKDAAVARFLGDFLLDESAAHPYSDIVADALRAHRFSFAIPMTSVPAG